MRSGVRLVVALLLIAGLRPGQASALEAARLSDYWAGRARWILHDVWTSERLGGDVESEWFSTQGARVEVDPRTGTWYLFHRKRPLSADRSRTQVRSSTDRGRTWSAPVDVVRPEPGTPWESEATDGDAWFDGSRWRYLFQCLGTCTWPDAPSEGCWQGCYAESKSDNPMDGFVTHPAPVITRDRDGWGSLWRRICQPATICASVAAEGQPRKTLFDEGTFDIFDSREGYFWVSFHGYNGCHGVRGIAKVRDFTIPASWVAGDSPENAPAPDENPPAPPGGRVPSDVTLSARDAIGWREIWNTLGCDPDGGSIGAGNASILAEGSHYYLLAELADLNLQARPGGRWDLGLFRARDAAAASWEPFPLGNPLVYSSETREVLARQCETPDGMTQVYWCDDASPCQSECYLTSRPANSQYPQLFRDTDGTVYMKHTREYSPASALCRSHHGTYVYRLVRDDNLLANGDLWTAGVAPWQARPAGGQTTRLSVERHPEWSSDGNQYLTASCAEAAAACRPGQAVYQEVAIPPGHAGRAFTFSGKFRPDADATSGALSLRVEQLDAAGRLLESRPHVTVSLAALPADRSADFTAYSSAAGSGRIVPGAATLRYVFSLESPLVYRADEMYLRLAPSGTP